MELESKVGLGVLKLDQSLWAKKAHLKLLGDQLLEIIVRDTNSLVKAKISQILKGVFGMETNINNI